MAKDLRVYWRTSLENNSGRTVPYLGATVKVPPEVSVWDAPARRYPLFFLKRYRTQGLFKETWRLQYDYDHRDKRFKRTNLPWEDFPQQVIEQRLNLYFSPLDSLLLAKEIENIMAEAANTWASLPAPDWHITYKPKDLHLPTAQKLTVASLLSS